MNIRVSGRILMSFCGGCALFACAALADIISLSDSSAGLGGRSLSGGRQLHASGGEAVAGDTAFSGTFSHQSGFIGAALVKPGVVNAEGVPVELTDDNDGDGLRDQDEISGAAFDGHAVTDHNVADTDGDGLSDGAESAAGFDPTDAGHVPVISYASFEDGQTVIEWTGRGGGSTNEIFWSERLEASSFTNLLVSTPVAGGEGPWFKTTSRYEDDVNFGEVRYYKLRIKR